LILPDTTSDKSSADYTRVSISPAETTGLVGRPHTGPILVLTHMFSATSTIISYQEHLSELTRTSANGVDEKAV
jgi:hypothetical protein